MSELTLDAIWRIANRYVPAPARYADRLRQRSLWGPAHELGHLLVATPHERTQRDFGLTCEEPGRCCCPGERCHVVELAAMDVSRRLVTMAGASQLADVEVQATPDYDIMAWSETLKAAKRLIALRRLRRLPRTTTGLRNLVRARLKETP